MRQSKDNTKLIVYSLYILCLLLTIPKSAQVKEALVQILSPGDLLHLEKYNHLLIFLSIFLEMVNILISIYIFKYIYLLAKLDISLIDNAKYYLSANFLSKIFSLIIPLRFTRFVPVFSNLIFLLVFIYLHIKEERNQKQIALISLYPAISLFFSFL